MFNCRFRNKKGGKEEFELNNGSRSVKIRKGKIDHGSNRIHKEGNRSPEV